MARCIFSKKCSRIQEFYIIFAKANRQTGDDPISFRLCEKFIIINVILKQQNYGLRN